MQGVPAVPVPEKVGPACGMELITPCEWGLTLQCRVRVSAKGIHQPSFQLHPATYPRLLGNSFFCSQQECTAISGVGEGQ